MAFLLLCSGYVRASVLPDSSAFHIRNFSSANLESYKAQKQFQYHKLSEVNHLTGRWWSDLLNWFQENIFRHITSEMILVLLLVILIVIFILQFNNIAFSSLFSRKAVSVSEGMHADTEDLKQADFEILIKKALSDRNFRLAIRFHFLKLIQSMGNMGIVALRDEKTNHEYLNEIADRELKRDFEPLINVFEYVWYGEYEPDEQIYYSLKQGFKGFEKQLGI